MNVESMTDAMLEFEIRCLRLRLQRALIEQHEREVVREPVE
jgi:hypothetical protein